MRLFLLFCALFVYQQAFAAGPVIWGPSSQAKNLQSGGLTTPGTFSLKNTSGSAPILQLFEAPANGTNKVSIQSTASLAADYTLTLPVDDGNSGDFLQTDGSGVLSFTPATIANTDSINDMWNLSLAASVGSSALTINLKDKSGSAPSSSSPVKIAFRNATAATGTYTVVSTAGALSVVVSSGSTLGHTSAIATYFYVYAINNAGTAELAISTALFDDGSIQTTTAEGGAGAADSATVLYSTTARSNVPIKLIGRMLSNQSTAGTWAAVPTEISLGDKFITNAKIGATAGLTPVAGQVGEFYEDQFGNNYSATQTDTVQSSRTLTPGIWLITSTLEVNLSAVSSWTTFVGKLFVPSNTANYGVDYMSNIFSTLTNNNELFIGTIHQIINVSASTLITFKISGTRTSGNCVFSGHTTYIRIY